ncbi:DNA ligase [Caulobacter phage Seuss]|uniref:DNA ligase n=1 Tax=Caulobacter phage Seuss TaxID=1675601 RepID=A0A0K1LM94_9CAUD|nr:DNA ligase [Caulobacter phage Seuss]AKU43584.1 DNA ligase [Caulobacter phage Seuss]
MNRQIYTIDKLGRVRVWFMEQDGSRHRTHHGLLDGEMTCSAWTDCVGKQGRTNVEQAAFEIKSGYEYQLKRDYFETIEEARKGPRYFAPQLAIKYSEMGFEKSIKYALAHAGRGDYAHLMAVEPKFDGFCFIAQASGMTSREGQPIVAAPHIMSALSPFFAQFPDAILHGELYNHDFCDDFETLSSILKKQNPSAEDLERSKLMSAHIYDYPSVAQLPLSKRKELLVLDFYEVFASGWTEHDDYAALVNKEHHLVLVGASWLNSEEAVTAFRTDMVKRNYEGAMCKLDIPYEGGTRSKGNQKHKVTQDGEFTLRKAIEGKGNYAGFLKAVELEDAEGKVFKAGVKGSKDERLKRLLTEAQPGDQVTIEYLRLTKRGVPKGGVAIKFHGRERTL